MLKLLKKRIYPIGVDVGSGYLRMAQLGFDGDKLYLYAVAFEARPEEISAGGPEWQRWAAVTIKERVRSGGFKGKNMITALPSDDVFIDQIRIPRTPDKKIAQTALSKVSKKLPFPAKEATLKHVVINNPSSNGEQDVLVMAAQQQKVDRHLAIYENAGVELHGISVWPVAMINSYTRFFSRRAEDQDVVSLLLDIGSNHTHVIICRQTELYFARMIPIGFNQLSETDMLIRLFAEIDACRRYYDSLATGRRIGKLMFLAGIGVDKEICDKVAELAQKMQVPAQMGDVFSAIEKRIHGDEEIDRRNSRISWATAFGLSLTEAVD
ncbi:MAG: pilus assembly protein PilM [Sedimentisphaerales bacterium]|nr:pilus assembly protein PilM [Sedimentisphaerales bacterium]